MKRLSNSFLRRVNILLAAMIAALGVVSCQHQKNLAKPQQPADGDDLQPSIPPVEAAAMAEQPPVCMYGVPRAEYVVHGLLVNSKGKPMQKQRISVSTYDNQIYVETDENGMFDVHFDGFPADSLVFEVEGKRYTEPVTYDGEPHDSWNRGTATMNVEIVHKESPYGYGREPVMLKYGVPAPVRNK